MDSSWTIQPDEYTRYIENFKSLDPQGSYVAGTAAREFFLKSSLPKAELARIWELSDITRDGQLDLTEFCIAMQLIRKRVKGAAVPDRLPGALQPVRVGLESRKALKNYAGSSSSTEASTLTRPSGASPQPLTDPNLLSSSNGNSKLTSTTGLQELVAVQIPPAPGPSKPRPSFTSSAADFKTPASAALSFVPGDSKTSSTNGVPFTQAAPTSLFESQPSFSTNFTASSQQSSATNQLRDISFDAPSYNNNMVPDLSAAGGVTKAGWNPVPAANGVQFVHPYLGNGPSGPVSGGISRVDSAKHSPFVTYIPPPCAEWEIPQPMRLRYNQAFHEAMKASSFGRAVAGMSMPGNQAKGIMLKKGVEQSILAHIWNLSDLDADGQLSSEEFCVAMHLLDEAQKGHRMPDMLPPLLVPPSYRRWWQDVGSKTTVSSGTAAVPASFLQPVMPPAMGGGLPHSGTGGADSGYAEGEFAALGNMRGVMGDNDDMAMQLKTFEDKRRENFSKGQAELDRRRQHLMDMERREREERERRERAAEAERQRHREEVERRHMQIEMERRMQQQLELERQQEDLRKKREMAVLESERQRYSELVRTRTQLLAVHRQRLQDDVHAVKTKLKNYDLELENDDLKRTTLNSDLEQLKDSVRERKGIIDGMREIRDQAVRDIEQAKHDKNEWIGKINYLRSEKVGLSGRKGALEHQSALPESLRTVDNSCKVRREVVNELRDKMAALEKSTQQKLQSVDEHNAAMRRIQTEFEELFQKNVKLCQRYDEKRAQLCQRMNRTQLAPAVSATESTAVSKQQSRLTSPTPAHMAQYSTPSDARTSVVEQAAPKTDSTEQQVVPNRVQYRALYAFEARNEDELSFQPGDVVTVSTDAGELEPGWIFGEVQIAEPAPFGGPDIVITKKGWLPANHVELLSAAEANQFTQNDFSSNSSVNRSSEAANGLLFHDPFSGAVSGGFSNDGHDAFSDAAGVGAFGGSFDRHTNDSIHSTAAAEKPEFDKDNGWAAFPVASATTAASHTDNNGADAFNHSSANLSGNGRISTDAAFGFGHNESTDAFEQHSNKKADFAAFPADDAFSPHSAATTTPKQTLFPPPSSSTSSSHRRQLSNSSNTSSNTPAATTAGAVNTATKIAMTLYPWTAKKDNHATFNKGEMVVIKKQVGGWCYGEPKQSQKPGWFPAAYVEIIKELPAGSNNAASDSTSNGGADAAAFQLTSPPNGKFSSSSDAVATSHPKAVTNEDGEVYQAEFDFSSDVSGDLSFHIGEIVHVTRRDGEWWTGYIGDDAASATRVGIFPANFVAKLAATSDLPARAQSSPNHNVVSSPSSSSQSRSTARHSRAGSKSAAPSAAGKVSSSGSSTPTTTTLPFQLPNAGAAQDVYQALAPFKAAGPEQLTLEKGDLVAVRQKSNTGWWEGELLGKDGLSQVAAAGGQNSRVAVTTGAKAGWFPGNFVKPFAAVRNA